MQEFEFSYDMQNDDLFIYAKGEKSKGSVELGSVIVDINSKGRVNAIQIMNASKYISKILDRVTKDSLDNIKACKIDFKQDQNITIIKIFIMFEKKQELMVPVQLPSISRSSPASI